MEDAMPEEPQVSTPILGATAWPTNAALIADVARLGYLQRDWKVLDPTYGLGSWWKDFRPKRLVKHDLRLDGVDFRKLPHRDRSFDAVAFDPPYKLNGTPSEPDERYGADVVDTWQGRLKLIDEGIVECARVTDKYLLVKCQDQVCSGKIRWQTHRFTDTAESCGLTLVDSFLMLGHRAQPDGRRQVHAYRNYSTLLVFSQRKLKRWERKGGSAPKKSSTTSPKHSVKKRSTSGA
jgi:hypothetical protein